MHNYNELKETWIYQDIKQQILEEVHLQQLADLRQTLFEIVEARFPRMLPLARKVAQAVDTPEEVRKLLVVVGGARTERDAQKQLEHRDDSPVLM
jgi:hypothetical protein